MSVRSGQSITTGFTTRVFSTGVATNGDSLPTGVLYVNGTADAATVTVTNITTGLYKAQVTLPTLAIGDVVSLVISATVSTVTDKAKIWEETKDVLVDSAGLVDANAVKVGPSGSGTAQTARDVGLSVLLSVGSGTGQVNLASGKVPATIAAGDLATDSVTAAAVKADAVTKIQSGLMTSGGYTAPDNTSITAIKAKTDNLPASPAAVGSAMTLTSAYDAAKTAASATAVAAIATILGGITLLKNWLGLLMGKIADSGTLAEVNATTSGASYDNTTDSLQAQQDAGGGSLTAAQVRIEMDANSIKLAHLDADISSRMATFSYTAPPTANTVADAILTRNMTAVEGSAPGFSLTSVVLAMLGNSISGDVLTVYRTDGTTVHLTKTLSTDSAAAPITGVH